MNGEGPVFRGKKEGAQARGECAALIGIWCKSNSDNAVCCIGKGDDGVLCLQFLVYLEHRTKYSIKVITRAPSWSFAEGYFKVQHRWGRSTFHIVHDEKDGFTMLEINQNDMSECVWYKLD